MTSTYKNEFESFFHEEMDYKILADRAQYDFVSAILAPTKQVQIIFCDSPAGTGKTAIALTAAYYLLIQERVTRIEYNRNAVSLRELGFNPGTPEEKEAVYMRPCIETMARIGKKLKRDPKFVEKLITNEQLVCSTTTYHRGSDMSENIVLILDEAQNYDLRELQTMLTRPHDCVKVIVIGSHLQVDNEKMKKFGPNHDILPFNLYAKHFTDCGIPSVNIELTKNYRGKLATHADDIHKTIAALGPKPKE
jgi:predicted ribonuclease YlaK